MNKMPMVENACKDLLQYGVFDVKARVKYLVKRYLLGRRAAGEDLIFWPTGLLAAGLWQCRQEVLAKEEVKDTARKMSAGAADFTGGADGADRKKREAEENAGDEGDGQTIGMIERALAAYYERWFQRGMPLAVLDDLLAGETLLNIWGEMQRSASGFGGKLSKEQVKTALDKMASFAAAYPTDEAGSFFYRPANGEKTVFVDSVGLAAPYLYQYGDFFEQQEYKDMALCQITNFFSRGMDGAAGLPYHGYDTADGRKYGIIGWGRAVGWLLRGMAGCMTSDQGREGLREPYAALMEAALAFQRPDGYFSWQLQALEGPADTSVTGMICAALKEGMRIGVLADAKYENALSAGMRALEKSAGDGRIFDCSGECEGFSCYPQRYGAFPWSLGPALEVL